MSASKLNQPSVILPKINRVMPNIIAEEIVGVQSMSEINMINPFFNEKWIRAGIDGPTDKTVYNIRSREIMTWIQEHPIYMWKYYDVPLDSDANASINTLIGQYYVFTDEMESWFLLRWS